MSSPREGGGRGGAAMGMSCGRRQPLGGAPVAEGTRRPRWGGQQQSGRHPPTPTPPPASNAEEGRELVLAARPPGARRVPPPPARPARGVLRWRSSSLLSPPSRLRLVPWSPVAAESREIGPCSPFNAAELELPPALWRRRQPPREEEAPPDPSRPRVRRRAQRSGRWRGGGGGGLTTDQVRGRATSATALCAPWMPPPPPTEIDAAVAASSRRWRRGSVDPAHAGVPSPTACRAGGRPRRSQRGAAPDSPEGGG
jgi:hypothetical protein